MGSSPMAQRSGSVPLRAYLRPLLVCDISVSPSCSTESLLRVCRECGPKEWRSDTSTWDDFTVTPVRGGLTNLMYACAHNSIRVVVRVYGANSDAFNERDGRVTKALGEVGMGKQVYGFFQNGRVEGWIQGRTLQPGELVDPDIAPLVGTKMAELHTLSLYENEGESGTEREEERVPTLWSLLHSWMDESESVTFDKGSHNAQRLEALDLPRWREYAREVEVALASTSSPVVFAHNDLHAGNILYDPSSHSASLIDWEFASWSYRDFDIANYMGEVHDCDPDLFPTQSQQSHFLRGYCSVAGGEWQDLYRLAVPWVPVSHLLWGFWGVIQAYKSHIPDFDYLEYARMRFESLKRCTVQNE
ncbi:hypothetical protein KIPB_004312 [Kipferlia bialata]|uniref:Choline/ethanolamine kinase n=1 Tax=Kipferlia bialata TaxID=797122 RepID=A0A391NQR7_9EUKA|nr:hypothetical protein KIPB_004312 [Kipferlia bialata]|eukprot:g4312.t1